MKIAVNAMVIDDKKAGVGNYAYNLVNALYNHDNEIKQYEINVFAQQDFWKKKDSRQVKTKAIKNISTNYKRIIFEQLFLPFRYKYGRYDIVHCLDYQSPFFHLKNKHIITVHDLSYYLFDNVFTTGQRNFKKINARWGIKRAEAIITDANSTKRDILRLFPGIDEEKIKVIYLGVNPIFKEEITLKEIEKVKREYKITGDYILYVGTLEPRKNIKVLIESFNQVIKKLDKSIKLVIAGKKGWMYDELFKKIEEYKLIDRIIFTGYVPDDKLPALYKGAKIFVYPSLYEGFGLPPLEAMSCGTPVITSNTSSLPEVVGDAGYLFDPNNAQELTDKILLLLNNEALRQEFINKGKKRSALFDWDKTAAETLKVYEKIKEKFTG